MEQENQQNQEEIDAENQARLRDPTHIDLLGGLGYDYTQLYMSNQYVSDQAFQVFAENLHKIPRLGEMKFNDNLVGDEGLKKLGENCHKIPDIYYIDLSANRIQHGLKYFCEISSPLLNLHILGLYDNQIDDQGLIALVENSEKYPKLQVLCLGKNKITDEGMIKLVQNAHKFPCVRTFSFQQNQITDKAFKALLQNMKTFPNLSRIYLSQNKIVGSGFRGMEFKFQQKFQLDLENNRIGESRLKELVSTGLFQNFNKLHLENIGVTNAGIKVFIADGPYPKLQQLYLGQNNFSYMQLLLLIKNRQMFPNLKYLAIKKSSLLQEQEQHWKDIIMKNKIFRYVWIQ